MIAPAEMNGMRNHVSIAIDPIPVSRGNRAQTVAACCLGVLVLILMISGFITECAGLSHTRHSDEMQRNCPSNYWNSAAGVLSLRAIIWVGFAIAAVVCWIEDLQPFPTAVLFWTGLFLLPLTLSNTVLTAQAWDAVSCTRAMMENNRDADPLIAAGSSILMLVDWIMLFGVVSWAIANFGSQPQECKDCLCDEGCCESDCCCNEGCCTALQACCLACSGCMGCVFGLSSFIVFIVGLVYAYNKSACPSAFWPFAITMFFVIPCCASILGQATVEKDRERFRVVASSACPCVVIIVLGLSIATAVMTADALQNEGCKAAMGNDGATGPLLAIAAMMYAIYGLIACIVFVCRCAVEYCH